VEAGGVQHRGYNASGSFGAPAANKAFLAGSAVGARPSEAGVEPVICPSSSANAVVDSGIGDLASPHQPRHDHVQDGHTMYVMSSGLYPAWFWSGV